MIADYYTCIYGDRMRAQLSGRIWRKTWNAIYLQLVPHFLVNFVHNMSWGQKYLKFYRKYEYILNGFSLS